MALVAGVNAILAPYQSYGYAIQQMNSPTGRCHTFDAAADGLLRAEGCGAVVLKQLDDALSDQNQFHAVVKGVSAAHGGKSASFFAPNGPSQIKVISEALECSWMA